MALLAEQQPVNDVPVQESQQPVNDEDYKQPTGGDGYGGISSEQLEAEFRKQMDKNQQHNFDQLLQAGNELLFGKETHYQLMDQLQNSKNIANDLGGGAFALMTMIIKQNGNVPGDVVLPAGVVLICRASEFLNQSGMAKVTDDDLEEATHVFGVKMMNEYDPKFRDKMQQSQQPQEQPQEQMAQQPPQQGGMLDMTGAQ